MYLGLAAGRRISAILAALPKGQKMLERDTTTSPIQEIASLIFHRLKRKLPKHGGLDFLSDDDVIEIFKVCRKCRIIQLRSLYEFGA